ncbi:MAG: helix-turn-helix domain-containing protein [Acidaminococcus sp.]|nr:helix-turn-helix domain-containing protein [Acidaminococcus sp.]MCI2101068.1 helix-turn-helix domain-containing protein [Acidaminococcus sp.]MCI2115481.1 helix-turn-helix domain-containing protein [Acidaminococcus sp.]MCI2117595.1 helix-turn-helix domain-containing protein [Acidaminococcus sp.]
MTVKFNDYLNEEMKNKSFKKKYEALEPERAIIQAIIDARKGSGLTQKELAAKSGMTQSDISKIENGNANPSIKTLQRLAAGMGKVLQINFV